MEAYFRRAQRASTAPNRATEPLDPRHDAAPRDWLSSHAAARR